MWHALTFSFVHNFCSINLWMSQAEAKHLFTPVLYKHKLCDKYMTITAQFSQAFIVLSVIQPGYM
jgi:hypothetical protein